LKRKNEVIEMRGELKNEIKELKEKLSKRRRNHALFHIPTYILILGMPPWLLYYGRGYMYYFEGGFILMMLLYFVILPLSVYGLIVLIVFIIRLNVLRGTIKQKEKEYKELSLEVFRKTNFVQQTETTDQTTKIP